MTTRQTQAISSRQELTVLIPVKNERRNIRPCIESIRRIANEILIADSGSSDGTLDIVQQIGGCRTIQREYINSANFKNWAIPQARHKWVLIIDADERAPHSLLQEVDEILREPSPKFDAYSCGFQDFFLGHRLRYAGWNTESIRLIQRDKCRYQTRRVHADIDIDPSRVGHLKTKMLHYSFWTYDEFIQKYARYTQWAADDLWEKGRRASFMTLSVRPLLRFLYLYLVRRGCLDGLPGLQVCILMSFFNTYIKQARLWQRESAVPQPDPEAEREAARVLQHPSTGVGDSPLLPTSGDQTNQLQRRDAS